MSVFTEEKFLLLTKKRQHKHAARILRRIIEENASLDEYSAIETAFDLPPLLSLEQIADRFHFHMHHAEIELSEAELLSVKKGDHQTGADFLEVDIFLDNLRSAHNVGSIIRIAEAFRLGDIYCGGYTPSHEKVHKSSMKAHHDVVIHREKSINDLIKRPLIAIETAENAIALNEFAFPESFSLILGNEELGVSQEGLKAADYIIEIPLYGKKNSLNVATAFAIVANHIRNA